MKENFEALLHFLYYASSDFIEQVWEDDTMMQDHLEYKLSSREPEDLTKFILNLDTGNRNLLYKYIEENHSNKW